MNYEQQVMQSDPIWVRYFWNWFALAFTPLMGFSAGQFYKAIYSHVYNSNPPQLYTMTIAGVTTGLFAAWFWPMSAEAIKIGVGMAFLQIVIVKAWFLFAAWKAPKAFASLKGTDGDMTIIPGLKVKLKSRQRPELDFDVTGR